MWEQAIVAYVEILQVCVWRYWRKPRNTSPPKPNIRSKVASQ